MLIKIYQNEDIYVDTDIFDNTSSIKNKIALKLDTLPKYIFKYGTKWLNLKDIINKDDIKEIALLLSNNDNQDFEKAGQLREREMEIKAQINAIALSKKGASEEANKTPTVTEEDIAQIVAAWTSIPVNKLTKSEYEKLLQMEVCILSLIGFQPHRQCLMVQHPLTHTIEFY